MGVPDTTTFTLQNVVDVVNPTTDDLVDCFSDASALKFDPAYSSNVGMLKFRNYDGFRTAFSASVADKDPCSLALNQTYYWDRTFVAPSVGDTIYTAATGTGVLASGNYKFVPNLGNTNNIMKINSSGVFFSEAAC